LQSHALPPQCLTHAHTETGMQARVHVCSTHTRTHTYTRTRHPTHSQMPVRDESRASKENTHSYACAHTTMHAANHTAELAIPLPQTCTGGRTSAASGWPTPRSQTATLAGSQASGGLTVRRKRRRTTGESFSRCGTHSRNCGGGGEGWGRRGGARPTIRSGVKGRGWPESIPE